MFRKRKVVAPHFRLPNPSNPVTGEAEFLHPPLKQFVAFELDEELTTGDENVKARIVDSSQWGCGIYHCSDVIVHVHNQPSALDASDYLFEGAEGEVGLAAHDHNNHWRIIWMAPPTTSGSNAVAYTEEVIPARDGMTPGGPTPVTKMKLSGGGFNEDGGVMVYSWIRSPSADPEAEEDGKLWIFIEKDEHGVWWFTGQDCPSGEDPPP